MRRAVFKKVFVIVSLNSNILVSRIAIISFPSLNDYIICLNTHEKSIANFYDWFFNWFWVCFSVILLHFNSRLHGRRPMPLHFIVSVLPVTIFLGWYDLSWIIHGFAVKVAESHIFSFEYQTPMSQLACPKDSYLLNVVCGTFPLFQCPRLRDRGVE